MEIVLTIAGSDSSAGAGIQQDLKTITALGCYGATAITAITSQNTLGVQHVMPLPPDVVRSQITSVMSDLNVSAVKIGMIPNREVAGAIVASLRQYPVRHIVYDPVMISTSGTHLMSPDCLDYVQQELFPVCTLITPNIPEAEALFPSKDYPFAVLVKGGHAEGDEMTDTLFLPDGTSYAFSAKRVPSTNLHGTGCTLSSAIATFLAQGYTLVESVSKGKKVINRGIAGGRSLHIGNGNGPLWL
jgi:hydroxymethylpyrimidine/phosphomethylpyrimidine kinase